MTCKLIAFDLDGTLLNDRKELPEENLRALEAAAERGVILVPATGRILCGVPEAIRTLPFIRYYIVSNGAAVFDTAEDRLLYRADIPLALALRVYDYLDGLPVLYDCYQDEIGWMSREMYERCAPYFDNEPGILALVERLRIRVDDLKETLREHGRPLQKIQMYFLPRDEAERQRQLRRIPELFPELIATTSVQNNIELNSVEATKGRALLALARELGVAAEETVAFGDGSNDIPMLRAAGLGVAMANSTPDVKAAAGEITAGNNEAGVAQTIRRILKESESKTL
ncbi:MAG: HAD family phosphatase [Oscillospiraceae bacterium]|nr:HAD family phosphatase [Oscillospiraceae bacterium]